MSTAARTIHHLNCGTMCPRPARLLTGRGGLLARAELVCHCLLIEGAEGLVLIDTGFGRDEARDPRLLGRAFTATAQPRALDSETAVAQIRARGLDPADVRQIVTTHLDPDHAGGLSDFPDAEVHLLGRELQAALHPDWKGRMRYLDAQWAHRPRWVQHEPGGDQWLGFASVRILPGSDAEILLIPLPGHTAGLTGVAIERDGRWMLHCGDAYFDQREIDAPNRCPRGLRAYEGLTAVNDRQRRQNQERLRELAARHGEDVELLCSHDALTLARYQGAPSASGR